MPSGGIGTGSSSMEGVRGLVAQWGTAQLADTNAFRHSPCVWLVPLHTLVRALQQQQQQQEQCIAGADGPAGSS